MIDEKKIQWVTTFFFKYLLQNLLNNAFYKKNTLFSLKYIVFFNVFSNGNILSVDSIESLMTEYCHFM